ncbi:MAG: hypothetical protein QGG48_01365 [Desulfatiglandales bacterium]|nr:hypothetical protein [Desulfatiglandales bacterium]
MIKEAIARVVRGDDPTEKEMKEAMEEVISGKATPAQVGSFITALRIKGETVDEITGAARVSRAKAAKVRLNNHMVNLDRDEINVEEETILDTCGTGGDGTNTFNVSLHCHLLCGRMSGSQGGQTWESGCLQSVRKRRCSGKSGR